MRSKSSGFKEQDVNNIDVIIEAISELVRAHFVTNLNSFFIGGRVIYQYILNDKSCLRSSQQYCNSITCVYYILLVL